MWSYFIFLYSYNEIMLGGNFYLIVAQCTIIFWVLCKCLEAYCEYYEISCQGCLLESIIIFVIIAIFDILINKMTFNHLILFYILDNFAKNGWTVMGGTIAWYLVIRTLCVYYVIVLKTFVTRILSQVRVRVIVIEHS